MASLLTSVFHPCLSLSEAHSNKAGVLEVVWLAMTQSNCSGLLTSGHPLPTLGN